MDFEPVWVRLPHLPLNLWHPKVLEAIGNCLGVFLKADLSYMQTGRRTVARILVGLQIYKGLADRLPIQYSCGTHVQPLNYEGLMFRCHRCHEWGHMVAECNKGARVTTHVSRGTQSCGDRLMPSEEGGRFNTTEVSSGSSKAENIDIRLSSGFGPDMEQGHINPLAPPAFPPEVVASSGMHHSPVPSSSFPLLLNFLSSFSCISLGASSNPLSLNTKVVMTDIPGPQSDSSPLVAAVDSQSISDDSLVIYNLRNRSIQIRVAKGGKGLGLMSPVSSPKKRGRKSLLTLAKERARLDIASGRQSSIIRTLREKDAQEGISP